MISDGHLTSKNPRKRRDNILKTSIRKFNFIVNVAKTTNAIILQAGDITHTPRDFQMLFHMAKILEENQMVIYYVKGEHDLHNRSKQASIMDILEEVKLAKRLTNIPFEIGSSHVYGSGLKENIPKVKDEKKTNILVCHKNISNSSIYPAHQYVSANKFLKKHNEFNLILCGHIHKHSFDSYYGRVCINTGPVVRRSIGERKHQPHVYLFCPVTFSIKKIGIPYSKTVFSPYIKRENRKKQMLSKFSFQTKHGSITKVNIKKILIEFINRNRKRLGREVIKILKRTASNEINKYDN